MSDFEPGETQFYRIGPKNSEEAKVDVVFIHGLGGHPLKTWMKDEKNENTFWPRWIAHDVPQACVWCAQYPSAPSGWTGESLPLSTVVYALLDRLAQYQFGDRPIVFVCHSLGGLVAKELLRSAFDRTAPPKWRKIASVVTGIAFLSTPHSGANLASFLTNLIKALGILGKTTLPRDSLFDLRANSPVLDQLGRWYAVAAREEDIATLAYCEDKPVAGTILVVPSSSADPKTGTPPVYLALNHWQICKPRDQSSQVYGGVLAFIRGEIGRQRRVPKHVAATDPKTAKRAAAISNISIGLPRHFMGREAEFARIESALQRQEGRVAIMALRGLRGVGKTTLAVAYADAHRAHYRATWWIRAHTVTTLRADIIALGIRIGWLVGKDKKELALPEQSALEAVTERLRDEGEGILLIFDHAIDPNELKPYLPRGGAYKALITTNAYALRAIAEPLEIRLWPKDVGADFLIARTGRERERAAALALSETLGGLPLALEQAAAYCERLNIPLSTYHQHFKKNPAQLLDSKHDASADFNDGLTVAQAFALAIEQAAKLHPGVELLIVHIALLGADQIPLFLFTERRDTLSNEIAAILANDSLDEAIGALGMFALIDRETVTDERNSLITTDVVHLHRLVREVVIDRTPNDALEDAYRSLVATLAAVYPEDIVNGEEWPRARRLDALALAMVGSDRPLPKDSEKSVVKLLYGLAAYRHYALGAYAEARPFYERALEIRERALGPDDLETAESLNNLAIVAEEQRDLSGARSFYERALAIREKVDCFSPDTAESLNGLARVLHDQGELAEARSFYERALAIREKAQDPSELAESLDNFATLLQDQKDLGGARLHYQRALHIREGLRNGSDTAETLEHLASLLSEVGELDEARSLYERALLIREPILDPKHPVIVENIRSLANLLNQMGRTGEAESLLQRKPRSR